MMHVPDMNIQESIKNPRGVRERDIDIDEKTRICLNRGFSRITQITLIIDFETSSCLQLPEQLVACFDIIRVIR